MLLQLTGRISWFSFPVRTHLPSSASRLDVAGHAGPQKKITANSMPSGSSSITSVPCDQDKRHRVLCLFLNQQCRLIALQRHKINLLTLSQAILGTHKVTLAPRRNAMAIEKIAGGCPLCRRPRIFLPPTLFKSWVITHKFSKVY